MKEEFELEIIDEQFKNKLKKYFQEVKKNKPGMGEVIFQIIYEWINNAVKANLKRIFFCKMVIHLKIQNPIIRV